MQGVGGGAVPTPFSDMQPSMGLPLGIYTNHFGKIGKVACGTGKDGRHGNCQYHGVDQVRIIKFKDFISGLKGVKKFIFIAYDW